MNNGLTIVLAVFLAVQCILTVFANLVLITENIDCDIAKLYVHAVEMWRNGRILIPGWSYLTTLELDCPLLFAVPLYGLTGNIFLSFGISNIIFLALYLWTFYYLFSGWGADVNVMLLSANLISIPYGIGQLSYFNMMFFNGGQYSMKVLIPLMLLALLVNMEKCHEKKGKRTLFICSAIYFLFVLISSFSSGIYVFICGLFPVLGGYLFCRRYYKNKVLKCFWWYGGGTLLTVAAGSLANFVLDLGSKSGGMALCSVMDNELMDNLFACFFGLFEVLGGAAYTNVKVLSLRGFDILFRMGFVLFLLFCAYFTWKKLKTRQADMLPVLFVFIFIWNTFILCICRTQYGSRTFEYRYHLMGIIPLMCVASLLVVDGYKKADQVRKRMIGGGVILVLVLLNGLSWREVLYSHKDVSGLQSVCEYAAENDLETVYFLTLIEDAKESEICRLLDMDSNRMYVSVRSQDGVAFVWDYYEIYTGMEVKQDDAAMVTYKEEEAGIRLKELFGDGYEQVMETEEFRVFRWEGREKR